MEGYLLDKYNTSGDIDELFSHLAFGVIGSSYSIYKWLGLKRHGRIYWSLKKRFNYQKYFKERRKREYLYIRCIIIVLNYIRNIFRNSLSEEIADELTNNSLVYISHQLIEQSFINESELDDFFFRFENIYNENKCKTPSPPEDDAKDLVELSGGKIIDSRTIHLIENILDCWVYIYPYDFIRNYHRLQA